MAATEPRRVVVGISLSTAGLRALRLAVTQAHQRRAALVTRAFAETMGERPADLDLVVLVALGAPGPVLVEYAHRDEDLLVVGVNRRPWWRRGWRLGHGSVARYCVAHASCPVQVMPPDAFAREAMRGGLGRRMRRELSTLVGS